MCRIMVQRNYPCNNSGKRIFGELLVQTWSVCAKSPSHSLSRVWGLRMYHRHSVSYYLVPSFIVPDKLEHFPRVRERHGSLLGRNFHLGKAAGRRGMNGGDNSFNIAAQRWPLGIAKNNNGYFSSC